MIPTELPTLRFLGDEGFQLNLKSRGGVSLLTWAASWLHSRGGLIVKAGPPSLLLKILLTTSTPALFWDEPVLSAPPDWMELGLSGPRSSGELF